MIVRNRRSFDGLTDPNLDVLRSPHFSGFEPLSGEFGDTITVSGYFENMVPSGLSVGLSLVDTFNQPGTTGFTFEIPNNSQSDTLSIATSGGSVSSTGVLIVSLSKPSISGYYSGINAPSVIDYDQVFKLGDTLTISGERLDLVTGVEFSGQSGSFGINAFEGQSYSNLSLSMPSINPDSGIFRVRDFVSRTSSHDSGINFNIISGFTNNLLPGETMTLSGRNVSGMGVSFPSATGNNIFISSANLSNSIDAQGVESITVNVPTGIVFGDLEITGRQNRVRTQGNIFTPIGVITGVSGFDSSNVVETGGAIRITGINCFDRRFLVSPNSFARNVDGLVGISGSGNFFPHYNTNCVVSLGTLDDYETGTATIGGVSDVFYNEFILRAPLKVVSGALFTVDPWTNQEGAISDYSSRYDNPDMWWRGGGFSGKGPSGYNATVFGKKIAKKISTSPDIYHISGRGVVISGIFPPRGAPGDALQVSGKYLNQVESVDFHPIRGTNADRVIPATGAAYTLDPPAAPAPYTSTGVYSGLSSPYSPLGGGGTDIEYESMSANFMLTGTTGMILFIPPVRVGTASLSFEGSPYGGQVGVVDVVARGPAVQYDIIPTGDDAPLSHTDRNVNYTIEEDIGGTVFLVTRTKFPDGSTLIVSSIPKP